MHIHSGIYVPIYFQPKIQKFPAEVGRQEQNRMSWPGVSLAPWFCDGSTVVGGTCNSRWSCQNWESLNACYVVPLLYSGFTWSFSENLYYVLLFVELFQVVILFWFLNQAQHRQGDAILCQEEAESKFRCQSSISASRFPVSWRALSLKCALSAAINIPLCIPRTYLPPGPGM